MTERQLQFRVGMFSIAAVAVTGVMVFKFGALKSLLEPQYTIAIHFESAPGLYPSTPVRKSGIAIGSVREITFDDKRGGVTAIVDIKEQYRLRADARPLLTRSLLGDAAIEFTPGKSRQVIQPGTTIDGVSPDGPMEIVRRLEDKLNETLDSFDSTSREWERVGKNINNLVETNHGNLDEVVERAAESLAQFTLTMQTANQTLANANKFIGDPQNQENLRKTLAAMPEMIAETHKTITAVKSAVEAAGENLENLKNVTGPLAKRSASIVTKLDDTMTNIESLTGELNQFAHLVNDGDGTIKRLAADPELYENMNRSAASLAILLKNLQPVVKDLRIFSDKVARHPELIGVSGAIRGSSGIKDPPPPAETPLRQSRGTGPLSRFPR
jgi:phospholipid/cholesterol/gamma-HCH transport system substrate-binding protein